MEDILLVNKEKDEIIIKINEGASYTTILEMADKQMPELKKMYEEEKLPIRITGRFLTENEMEEIKTIIKKEIDAPIIFDNINELGLHVIKKPYEQNIENSETYFFKGGIRSGQRVEFEGSIVVLGDVNSGAEVIAGGNIVILGILRGLAHAGAKGNKKAIIASHKIESVQLRIANVLKEIEKEEIEETKQFASIKEDKIILE